MDSNSTLATDRGIEDIGILAVDPSLQSYQDHFKYRVAQYVEKKSLFEKYEGSLEEFAQGDVFNHHCYALCVFT